MLHGFVNFVYFNVFLDALCELNIQFCLPIKNFSFSTGFLRTLLSFFYLISLYLSLKNTFLLVLNDLTKFCCQFEI